MGFSCEGCGRYIEGVPHSISGKPFCDQCRAGTEQAYHARGAGREAEALAKAFHEAYERLAPQFGYETRKESVVAWADVPERNRKLMIAVCAELREPGADTGTTPVMEQIEDWCAQSDGTVIFERMVVRKTPTASTVEHSEPERLYFMLHEPGAGRDWRGEFINAAKLNHEHGGHAAIQSFYECGWSTCQLAREAIAEMLPRADIKTTPLPTDGIEEMLTVAIVLAEMKEIPAKATIQRWRVALFAHAAAERGTTPPRETAWLIERHDMTRTQWLCCDSGEFEWTADPLKPLRLARREDAEQLALLALPNRDDIDVRITEHQWGM